MVFVASTWLLDESSGMSIFSAWVTGIISRLGTLSPTLVLGGLGLITGSALDFLSLLLEMMSSILDNWLEEDIVQGALGDSSSTCGLSVECVLRSSPVIKMKYCFS